MVEFEPSPVTMREILKWEKNHTLFLSPKFQRRSVWKPKAKQYLIDTMLNQLPMPKLFMRLARDPKTGKQTHEIVDGQQRLRSVIEFTQDSFKVPRDNKKGLSGLLFSELPTSSRRTLLNYTFVIDLLIGAEDRDVYDLFRRLNTYTYSLSRQEKRNGSYFGPFKRTVYSLSGETYEFWIKNRIFTPSTISRMAEAELISELLLVMMKGLQDKKEKPLRKIYEALESEGSFKNRAECVSRFRHCLKLTGSIFGKSLRSSEFRRRPLFFSLFCVVFDALYVMPDSGVNTHKQTHKITSENYKNIRKALIALAEQINATPPEKKYLPFVQAIARQTDNLIPRKTRHKFIWDAVSPHLLK
jgi:hypothetical protein